MSPEAKEIICTGIATGQWPVGTRYYALDTDDVWEFDGSQWVHAYRVGESKV